MSDVFFTRVLRGGEVGIDIEGIGRALCKADAGYVSLRKFNAMPTKWRRTYGLGKQRAVDVIRKREGWKQTGIYDERVHFRLIDDGCFDARAENFMRLWEPPAALVHPVPLGFATHTAQVLHETGGLPGNWAWDFGVPEITGNLTPVVAVIDATVKKLSGSAPSADGADSIGAYGWSIHYESKGGYRWFWTHFGRRAALIVGQRVRAGEVIGWIGDQRYRPDHVHGGVTSPLGEADARKRIEAVVKAPRVQALA